MLETRQCGFKSTRSCEALLGDSSSYGFLLSISSMAPNDLQLPNITFTLETGSDPVVIHPNCLHVLVWI